MSRDSRKRNRSDLAVKHPVIDLPDESILHKQIIANAQNGVIVYGPDLKYLVWNPFMESISGKSADEVLGKDPLEVFPFLKESGVVENHKMALAGGTPETIEFPYDVPETGKSGWVTNRSGPLRNENGEIIGVIAIVQDITERKRAEETLRESEEKYRRLVENLGREYFFYRHNLDGVFTFISSSIFDMLGYTQEEFLTHYTEYLTDNPINMDVQRHSDLSIQGVQQPTYEVEIFHKNGERRWLEVSEAPVRDKSGSVEAVEGIARDITRRKRNEEERASLQQQLHQAQKMEAIGQLAGGIAHDFNNILAIIIGTAEQVFKGLPETAPGLMHLERITRVAKRAKDLTMSLLTFARKEKLDVRSIRTDELVHELIDLLKRSISKKIRIQSDCSVSGSSLTLDVNQMVQALLNVCINAADSMPEGGTLAITYAEVPLGVKECGELPGIAPGRYSRIAIEDTGTGMPEKVSEQIFTPFFTTKERGKGTGLGLPITLGIVQSHGGAISVDSETGRGTRVEIYLPVSDELAPIQAKPEVEKQQPEVRGTVLIVDDDQDFLDMTAEILQERGFSVIPAFGPAKALELFRKHEAEIDLVILDMMMPEMGGDEVFWLLRNMNPGVKVLVCSGYSKDGKARLILNEEASGFLQKPFDSEQLVRGVSGLLR